MAQATDDEKLEPRHDVWPTKLLLNQAYALTFSCIKCNGIPITCMNNDDGEILCNKCALNMANISPNKAVQKMINNLKTKCLSAKADKDESEGNIIVTQIKDNECVWIGMIPEWDDHSKQCPYLVISCNACKTFQCQRKLLHKHNAQCPEVSINCPLLCGSLILRKNAKIHLAIDCNEQLVDCSNDDCKMQMKRKDFKTHINNKCDMRIVECSFVKYGCPVKNIKVNDLNTHMEEYKFVHLSNKFDFVTATQNETISELRAHIIDQANRLDDITNRMKQIEDEKAEPLWKNALYSTVCTETECRYIGNKMVLLHMILPEKAGRYVCKYSFSAHNIRRTTYASNVLSLGNIRLSEKRGMPLSGSVIVELKGDETEHERGLALSHIGRFLELRHCFLECYELP